MIEDVPPLLPGAAPTSSRGPALDEYDVVVLGGAFSGSSTALLIQQQAPDARVLIVERSEVFDRRVGEATVEVSGNFICSVLGLYDLLSREHLPKHGLRYWFTEGGVGASDERRLDELSEIGPNAVPGLPSFQLDRAKFDSALLERAAAGGAELLRPAKVTSVELDSEQKEVTLEVDGETHVVKTRWIVDASGRQAFIGRRLDLIERNAKHPTNAMWARWKGVADMDGKQVLGDDPMNPRLPKVAASRRLATNHFCGFGWWCWVIPLTGGETSIGVVWDERYYTPPATGSPRADYERFVRTCPGLRELLEGAEIDSDDFRTYRHLAYRAKRFAGDGWVLVGDAASFIDPFYSPGLDFASMSAYASALLISRQLNGELEGAELTTAVEDHNGDFDRSYERWFTGLYEDKYAIFGDAELMAAAFLLDTSLYYLGVVGPVYRNVDEYRYPVLGRRHPGAWMAHRTLRFYNRRLAKLAHARREHGIYGRRNVGWRLYPKPFHLGLGTVGTLRLGLRYWLGAELDMAWRRVKSLWKRRSAGPVGGERAAVETGA